MTLLKSPEKAYTHIGRFSNSIIMSVAFGKRCPRYETEHSQLLFEMEHAWESLVEIGAQPPVDLIPILCYVPERWAPWKTLCRKVRSMQRKLYIGLLEECEDRLRRGIRNGCYMEDIIEKKEELGMDREMVAYLGGVMLEAGSETTTSFLRSLILAFIEYPETQRKAQEEIDRVIGEDHAPRLEDFAHLPYIQALIKETHRFRPSTPLGAPHANLAEVEYKGYIIPKDTMIFLNTWGIFHDPSLFHQPEVFNPDRYLLTEHGTIPGANDQHFRSNLIFGAGRRICPGLTLANNSLMLSVMYLIWAFDFSDSVDMTTGKPFSTDIHNFTKGIAITATPFKCRINPRSKLRADIIEHQFVETIDTFVKFEDGLDEGERAWLAATREKLV